MIIKLPIDWKEHYGIIYKLTCQKNGKIYIGQTTDFPDRMDRYRTLNCKGQKYLYAALYKYGLEKFDIEIIDIGTNDEILTFLEDHYMRVYNSLNREFGYNLREAGPCGKHAEETKKQIGDSNRGKKRSLEVIKAMSERQKGFTHTEQMKKDLSEKNKGKQPCLGYKHTEEAKANMSKAQKMKWGIMKKNNKDAGKGKTKTPEQIKKWKETYHKNRKENRHPPWKKTQESIDKQQATRKRNREAEGYVPVKQSQEAIARRVATRKRNREEKLLLQAQEQALLLTAQSARVQPEDATIIPFPVEAFQQQELSFG